MEVSSAPLATGFGIEVSGVSIAATGGLGVLQLKLISAGSVRDNDFRPDMAR
jgi:hypothetical protein